MNKITFYLKDGSQTKEEALWENANAATVHAKEQMKWKKNIHMASIVPTDGTAPTNIIREEK